MFAQSYALSSASSMSVDMAGIEWQKMLGGSMGDAFFDIQPTNDGNYIAAGASGSWDMKDDNGNVVPGYESYAEAWITKIDPTGKILWEKLIGGNGYDQAMSIQQTSDGGYIFAGFSNSTDGVFADKNHGTSDGWVVKLDSNGNQQWQTLLGGSNDDELLSIHETPDNKGYIVAGYTNSSDIANANLIGMCRNTNAYVAKLDLSGNIVWQDVIGGSDFDYGSSIIPASNGGYILTGYTESNDFPLAFWKNHGYNDIFVMKLDESGNQQWINLIGGENGEATAFGNAIQPTLDGGYILIGQSLSSHLYTITGTTNVIETTHGSSDVLVVKLDQSGNIQWLNLLGGTGYDDGTAIQQTSHGDYILVGRTTSSNSDDVGQNHGGWDIWAAKLDSTGDLLWQDVLGGSAYEQSTAIQPTPDEGFILAGYTESSNSGNVGMNHGYQDGWIVKLKPRLVVDVEDSNSHNWVPNVYVTLTDDANNENQIINAIINGRVVFNGSGISGQYKFVKGNTYTIKSTADNYHDSTPVTIQFNQDGQSVKLSQAPLIVPYDNSFSITCVEKYDYLSPVSGSIDECNNLASDLISAGYKMNFYHKDGDVTKNDFAMDPSYTGDTITESAFHYHSGHGTEVLNLNIPVLNEGWWRTFLDLKGYDNIPFINTVDAGDVTGKWGGKLKWVMLDSCNILKDENWHKALVTTHGILGFSTDSGVNLTFPDTFTKYALNKDYTIVDAYKQATIDTYHDDNTTATVITKTSDQYYQDHFPGTGPMASDGDPNSNDYKIRHWNCRSEVVW